jgi:hypothetical protein
MSDVRASKRGVRRGGLLLASLLLAVSAMGWFTACDHCDQKTGVCVDDSSSRLIEKACSQNVNNGPSCFVTGDGQQTSGLTEDSLGYRLGPAGGTFTLHLLPLDSDISANTGAFDIDVLVANTPGKRGGSITTTLDWGSSCTGCVAPTPSVQAIAVDYQWVRVIESAQTNPVQKDSVIRIAGKDADILDIRTTLVYKPTACSVAAPGAIY